MDLSILIVNWNVRPLIERCLDSIFHETKNLKFEVIVVDNDSRDGSAEILKRRFDNKIKLIINKHNAGFARANNQALALATGEFILYLNPDTELRSNALLKAVDYMRQNKNCGVLGCQLIGIDGTIQPSVRKFPTLSSQVLILLKLHHLFLRLKILREYFQYDFDYRKLQEVDQVMGAFLMTRMEIIKKIGSFDENFFLWFEEVDFCRRVKRADYQVIYDPDVQIVHFGHQSFCQVLSYSKQYHYNRSMIYFFKKYYPQCQVCTLLLIQPISLILAKIIQIIRSPWLKSNKYINSR